MVEAVVAGELRSRVLSAGAGPFLLELLSSPVGKVQESGARALVTLSDGAYRIRCFDTSASRGVVYARTPDDGAIDVLLAADYRTVPLAEMLESRVEIVQEFAAVALSLLAMEHCVSARVARY